MQVQKNENESYVFKNISGVYNHGMQAWYQHSDYVHKDIRGKVKQAFVWDLGL